MRTHHDSKRAGEGQAALQPRLGIAAVHPQHLPAQGSQWYGWPWYTTVWRSWKGKAGQGRAGLGRTGQREGGSHLGEVGAIGVLQRMLEDLDILHVSMRYYIYYNMHCGTVHQPSLRKS